MSPTASRAGSYSSLVETAAEVAIAKSDGITHVTPLYPLLHTIPASTTTQTDGCDQPTANSLLDREQVLINALLLPFRNIVELAPLPEGEVTKEAAAAQCFQMKVETQALVCLSFHSLIRW
jgi:hypothetical protein